MRAAARWKKRRYSAAIVPQAGEEEEHGEERRWLARARKVSVPWQPVLSRPTP